MKQTLLTVLLAAAGFQANAAVIDFNLLTGLNLVSRGTQYVEDGFQLNTTTSFASIQSGSPSYTGTPSFYVTGSGVTTLTKVGGGAFSFESIDLDSYNAKNMIDVTFVATLVDGGTSSQTFRTNNAFPNLQTFTFSSGFNNVLSVAWTQTDPAYSFDNISVTAKVPEPSALAVFGLGLLAFTATMRKKVTKK